MCEDDPGDFEQSIFQAPSLTSEDKKRDVKYFAVTWMHTSDLCDRGLAVYNRLLLSFQGLAEAYVQDLEQCTLAGARLSLLLVPAELLGSGPFLPHAFTLAWSVYQAVAAVVW